MNLENQTLYPAEAVAAIEERLRKAYSHGDTWMLGHYHNDEGDFHKSVATSNILEAWQALLNLLETYGHNSLLTAAQEEFESCKQNPTASEMGQEEPYLVWPYEVQKYVNIFKELHLKKHEPAVSANVTHLVEAIHNSEYYIMSSRAFSWMPAREDDVHRRIEGMLKCFFTDLLHKPPLPKPIKSFEPDTGIPSLGVLIDYKYIESQEAGRRILDEILADIGGYQSELYNQFIFVIYETQRCFTEDEWNRAIMAAKPRNPVLVIVIRGAPPSADDRRQSDRLKKSFDKAKNATKRSSNKGVVLTGDPLRGPPASHP